MPLADMLDQKDPLFYEMGVIPQGGRSSLCGPTSVMNWLQLRYDGRFSKVQLVDFVRQLGADLRKQNIEINNGLTESQLLEFMKVYAGYLDEGISFGYKGRSQLTLADLLNSKVQILMLRYAEPVRFSPGPIRREDYNVGRAPVRGNHYVLKISGSAENSELQIIDPENPHVITRVRVETDSEGGAPLLRIYPLTKEDLSTVAFGVPLQWSLTGAIEEIH